MALVPPCLFRVSLLALRSWSNQYFPHRCSCTVCNGCESYEVIWSMYTVYSTVYVTTLISAWLKAGHTMKRRGGTNRIHTFAITTNPKCPTQWLRVPMYIPEGPSEYFWIMKGIQEEMTTSLALKILWKNSARLGQRHNFNCPHSMYHVIHPVSSLYTAQTSPQAAQEKQVK